MQETEGGEETETGGGEKKRRQKTKPEKLWRELPPRKSKRKQTNQPSAPKKRKNAVPNSEVDGIDSNECCVCHGTYTEDVEHSNGSQWLRCQCG